MATSYQATSRQSVRLTRTEYIVKDPDSHRLIQQDLPRTSYAMIDAVNALGRRVGDLYHFPKGTFAISIKASRSHKTGCCCCWSRQFTDLEATVNETTHLGSDPKSVSFEPPKGNLIDKSIKQIAKAYFADSSSANQTVTLYFTIEKM